MIIKIILILIIFYLIFKILSKNISKNISKNTSKNISKTNDIFLKEYFIQKVIDEKDLNVNLPDNFINSFNWTTNNNQYSVPCLTPIRDQGECGCCYAMVITTLIESAYYRSLLPINANPLVLSAQQIIDCASEKPGPGVSGGVCEGCGGCDIIDAANFLFINNFKICLEYDYSSLYKYQTNDPNDVTSRITLYNFPGCLQTQKCPETYINLSLELLTINIKELQVKKALYLLGPLIISTRLPEGFRFNFYGLIGGIYRGELLEDPNHGMVLVGWSFKKILGKKLKYWIIQNSWGPRWANKGFLWIPRNDSGTDYGYHNIFSKIRGIRIKRPVPCEPSCVILKSSIYCPNNITKINITVEATIPDTTYYIVYTILSKSDGKNWVNALGLTDSNNNVIYNNQKVVDNENNYRFYPKRQNYNNCIFKKYFNYELDIDIPEIIFDFWLINIKIYEKISLNIVIEKNEYLNIDTTIIINNIDLLTHTINYNIIEANKFFDANLLLYKIQFYGGNTQILVDSGILIYEENLSNTTTQIGNYNKTIPPNNNFIGISEHGIYQFFLKTTVLTLFSNPFQI
jgi:hypothetical protein